MPERSLRFCHRGLLLSPGVPPCCLFGFLNQYGVVNRDTSRILLRSGDPRTLCTVLSPTFGYSRLAQRRCDLYTTPCGVTGAFLFLSSSVVKGLSLFDPSSGGKEYPWYRATIQSLALYNRLCSSHSTETLHDWCLVRHDIESISLALGTVFSYRSKKAHQ